MCFGSEEVNSLDLTQSILPVQVKLKRRKEKRRVLKRQIFEEEASPHYHHGTKGQIYSRAFGGTKLISRR